MMHIIVHNRHPLQPMLHLGMHRPQGHIIKQTKPHPSITLRVVARGTDKAVGIVHFSCEDGIDGVQHPPDGEAGDVVGAVWLCVCVCVCVCVCMSEGWIIFQIFIG